MTTAKVTDNPADELVAVLNKNRTAHKESSLYDNPGLACIALQYIKAYEGDCSAVGGTDAKKPPDSSFADTFAPQLVVKSLDILYSKNHTEVGAAVTGTDGGAPYFWCVLFSNGKHNASFLFEDGVAKISRPGCFSGANDECSGVDDLHQPHRLWPYAITALIAVAYGFGL
ncbi:hypothetical protein Patl1_13770 [Pistacia atlantica]|uniref:Uncharacterized protein n=1 Tax=Pistacia atlantica TaxID=434234 RepID=A0ACC1ATD0_9ROSI|nr:hypothetical protein Patl1_13770 [Pistacia atlantica]